MRSTIGLYGSRRAITEAWDETQARLQCCGVDSWHDWNRIGPVPESCCQEVFGGQRKECTIFPTITNLYGQGCLYVATHFIRDHAAMIGGSAVGVAIIMVINKNIYIICIILFLNYNFVHLSDIWHDILKSII